MPPTANLARIYGRGSLGTISGLIFCSHMVGAAIAAYLARFFSDYRMVFISAALLGFVAVALTQRISVAGVTRRDAVAPA